MIEDFTKRKENQRKKKRTRKQRSPGEPERALKLHHRSNLSEKENEPQKFEEDFTMTDKRKEKQTKKKKKRKQRSPEESERPIKLHRRINSSEKENEPQWRNLELIISIDKRELDLLELVYFSFFFCQKCTVFFFIPMF